MVGNKPVPGSQEEQALDFVQEFLQPFLEGQYSPAFKVGFEVRQGPVPARFSGGVIVELSSTSESGMNEGYYRLPS